MRPISLHLIPLAVAMTGAGALPAQASNMEISITGTITVPTCVVNGGQTIEVDFGDLPVDNLADAKYRQKKEIQITCQNRAGIPYIRITGAALSGAEGNILATSVSHLGIALYQGDGVKTRLMLGNGTNFNGSFYGYPITEGLVEEDSVNAHFTFTAVPCNVGNVTLQTGAFSASASMAISYY